MASSFTPEQKAFIRQVVYEAMPSIIEAHVNDCPWGKKVVRFIWVGIGIGICLSILGFPTIGKLLKLF